MKETLLRLADELDEIAELPEEYDYSELGDWFASWGSMQIDTIAYSLRNLAREED